MSEDARGESAPTRGPAPQRPLGFLLTSLLLAALQLYAIFGVLTQLESVEAEVLAFQVIRPVALLLDLLVNLFVTATAVSLRRSSPPWFAGVALIATFRLLTFAFMYFVHDVTSHYLIYYGISNYPDLPARVLLLAAQCVILGSWARELRGLTREDTARA